MRVVNRTRKTVLGDKVRTAGTFLSRLVGLLGTAGIEEGGGLWIVPCRSVHTLGMRYPIDVAFVDARGIVVGVLGGLPPNRIGRVFRHARGALELRAGVLAATGTAPGDRLEFKPAFLARVRSEVVEMGVDTRRATEGPGGVVETTVRSPTERNAVDMPISAAAVEAWREMRAKRADRLDTAGRRLLHCALALSLSEC